MSDLYEKRRTQNSISLIYESSKRGKYIASLEARIAELEKLAVVWHKYPDEKPDDNRDCLVFGKAYCVMSSSIGVGYYENDEWVCVEIGDITHYAELPAPPEEQ